MTFFEAFHAYTQANAGFVALVSKVYPVKAPQATAAVPLPDTFMVVTVTSGLSEPPTHEGASPWCTKRVRVTVYATRYVLAERAIAYTRAMFGSFNGYLGGGSSVRWTVSQTAGPRSINDELTRMDGVQLDIIGLLNESTVS